MKLSREAIRALPCPACGAKAGVPCNRFRAGRHRANHVERMQAAQKVAKRSRRVSDNPLIDEGDTE